MRLVFGAGYVGARVAALAVSRGEEVLVTVRSEARAAELSLHGRYPVTREPVLEVAARMIDEASRVVVCFPPDGTTDAALAPLLARAASVVYVSTTGVYGDARGIIDDTTPLPEPPGKDQLERRRAEAAYRTIGGTVLRAPGIYGADRGLHVRVRTAKHTLPGDGSNFTSRIHVEDLAALLLACDRVRGETFVVGDLAPARQRDVVQWICDQYGCPFPPSVAPEQVHETLRRDRRVDPSRALQRLGVTLQYPTFHAGMKPSDPAIE